MKITILMLGLMLSGCAFQTTPTLELRIALLEMRVNNQKAELERTAGDLEYVKQIQKLRQKRFDDADDLNEAQSVEIRNLQSWQDTQKRLETPPAAAPPVPVKTLPYRKTK